MGASVARGQYRWRLLTAKERQELLTWRKLQRYPWHSPPHFEGEQSEYHISAACYEHHPHIACAAQRMQDFSSALLESLQPCTQYVYAWCVLPNHYHALVRTGDLKATLHVLGRLHGRTSFHWNGEENSRGRKVWFNAVDRFMRNDRHRWATINYIHHNPVHHGYVSKWQDWPFSSAREYLEAVGPKKARRVWREYPIWDYGKGWDDPAL